MPKLPESYSISLIGEAAKCVIYDFLSARQGTDECIHAFVDYTTIKTFEKHIRHIKKTREVRLNNLYRVVKKEYHFLMKLYKSETD